MPHGGNQGPRTEKNHLQHQQNDSLIDTANVGRISHLCATLTAVPEEYDDDLTRELIKSIIVQSDGTVDVALVDGSEMKGLKQG